MNWILKVEKKIDLINIIKFAVFKWEYIDEKETNDKHRYNGKGWNKSIAKHSLALTQAALQACARKRKRKQKWGSERAYVMRPGIGDDKGEGEMGVTAQQIDDEGEYERQEKENLLLL